MPVAAPSQVSFSRGEISPLLHGRRDLDIYLAGLAHCENFVILPHGVATRRPGTRLAAEANIANSNVRLIPIEYSETDSYVLEFGDDYFRVYRDFGLVGSGDPFVPYVFSSTGISASILFEIDFAFVEDALYIVHESFAPKKLTRVAHDNWTLATHALTGTPVKWTRSEERRVGKSVG